MKKYIIPSVSAFVLGFSLFAAQASAQTFSFQTDMGVGSRGNDVINLQTFLLGNGYSIPSITAGGSKGYFGVQTEQAVERYQANAGLPQTGFVGPLTRARLNTGVNGNNPNPQVPPPYVYPQPQPSSSLPVINGVTAPTNLSVNQTGTWTVRATDPRNGTLSYSVNWGDNQTCLSGYACPGLATASAPSYYQTSTFTHAYANSGTYTVTFTVTNSYGNSSQTTATVNVSGGTTQAGPLRITSPNAGEIWQRGTTQAIIWTSPYYYVATTADLKLVPYQQPCVSQICPMYMLAPYTIATGIGINQNLYNWTVGSVTGYATPQNGISVPDGQYSIQICQSGGTNCDTSDAPFTITSGSISSLPDINVVSPNGGEYWQAGSNQTIIVNISGNQSQIGNTLTAALVNSGGQQFSLYTSGYQPMSVGQRSFTVQVPSTIPSGQYKLFVNMYNQSTQQAYDYSDNYFTVTSATYPNYPVYNSVSGCPAGYVCTPQ